MVNGLGLWFLMIKKKIYFYLIVMISSITIDDIKDKIHNFVNENENDKLGCYNIENYAYITEFKHNSLEERIDTSNKILEKYTDRVPVIVDCKKDINISKNKYIVQKELSVAQFIYIIKKRIDVHSSQAIFLVCNNRLVNSTDTMDNIYHYNKHSDGFLYIILSLENVFG